MKKLLLYDQLPGTVSGEICGMNFEVEYVTKISEVFGKRLFGNGESGFDVFLVNIQEPTMEMIDFLNYIKKNADGLPMIITSEFPESFSLLKNILKGLNFHVSELPAVPEVLDRIVYAREVDAAA
ncbi:hypothetical protein [Dyadobacter psychrotolerans]|uniref:Response regulator n=1 Tax=Dyadobacter psychrotolerans TaxID=2541721 RepID=A0A4R5DU33_9BACT|nr:hypothetical protein [Dyadobacter psychrotolerans]TDE14423.1 hypothetical protein E0F88_14575 [Dyadobacter psychrotolerans]